MHLMVTAAGAPATVVMQVMGLCSCNAFHHMQIHKSSIAIEAPQGFRGITVRRFAVSVQHRVYSVVTTSRTQRVKVKTDHGTVEQGCG